MSWRRWISALLWMASSAALHCGETPLPARSPEPKPITDAELQRVARDPVKKFPWPALPPPAPVQAVKQDAGPLPDMSSGDIIIRAHGEFTRELAKLPGGSEDKEVITLNKDVEIEFPKSVLRSQRIKLWRSLKDSRVERLEATGDVQLVTPDTKARAESLIYVVTYDAEGRELKTQHTLEGNKASDVKATLWKARTPDHWEADNVDKIEAEKFISDEDTLRAVGRPAAVFNVPANEQLPGFSLAGLAGEAKEAAPKDADSGRYRLQADGELSFDAPLGRMRILRNVEFQGPGMRIAADEMVILMAAAAPGQGPAEGRGLLSGSLKSMECSGRLEIKAPPQTVHCDKFTIDVQRNSMLMEMKNPADSVRVYTKEAAGTGRIIVAPKRLSVNTATNEFQAGGPLKMESFTGAPPAVRK